MQTIGRVAHAPFSPAIDGSRVGTVRVGVLRQLPEFLREHGIEVDSVLRDVALPANVFDDPDNTITASERERLLLECERRSGHDDIGLLITRHVRIADLGLAGQLALCAPTAGEGLARLVEHFNLHSTTSTVSVIEHGTSARLVFAVSEPGLTDTRHVQLGAAVCSHNVLRELFGPHWSPSVVTCACRAPANLGFCHRYFDSPVRFDEPETAVHFDRHWLDTRLPPADPGLVMQLEVAARERRLEAVEDLPRTLRRLVRRQMMLGRFSMDDVAALLSMHRRTLDRHLERYGLQYGEVVDSVKQDVARQLLRETAMPIQRISEALHFSSSANFATAFRRRAGITPSEFRRRCLVAAT